MVAMRDPSDALFAVGRYTGREPLGFEAGDANWYRFVANGPTGRADPSGLRKCTFLREVSTNVFVTAYGGTQIGKAAGTNPGNITFGPVSSLVCVARVVREAFYQCDAVKSPLGGKDLPACPLRLTDVFTITRELPHVANPSVTVFVGGPEVGLVFPGIGKSLNVTGNVSFHSILPGDRGKANEYRESKAKEFIAAAGPLPKLPTTKEILCGS